MKRISLHISYDEATKSPTAIRLGIDNTPTPEEIICMEAVGEKIFEPVRNHFGRPIYIPSFFRCPRLNHLVGGADNSQHTKGEAIDLDADKFGGMTNADIFHFIVNNLEFDQLIWEFGDDNNPAWVHCSYSLDHNRKEVLYAKMIDNKKVYSHIK